MNRKQRRTMNKQMGKEATDNLAQKISSFDKLPEMCTACEKELDKKSKEFRK